MTIEKSRGEKENEGEDERQEQEGGEGRVEVGRELLEQGRQGGSMWFRYNIFCFQLRGLG